MIWLSVKLTILAKSAIRAEALLALYEEETLTSSFALKCLRNILPECELQYIWANEATGIGKE